jgi:hypothetical protein
MKENEEKGFASSFDDHICTLLNAEEILMCAGLEIKLGIRGKPQDDIHKRLVELFKGAWPKVVKPS